MFIKLNSAAALGLDCLPVDVEVDINKGQTAFNIVGLPDTSIHEARDRIHSALKNSGFIYPFNFRVLVNLAPADVPKEGTAYDLPMALGIIILSNNLRLNLAESLFVGELALDGSLRRTNGILPLAVFAKQHGLKKIYIPEMNAPEAALVSDLEIYPIKNLKQVVQHIVGTQVLNSYQSTPLASDPPITYELDMAHIKGQEFAKRALEIAGSGGHNVLMTGPPGSGKTLLAKTFPSILPKLNSEELLEVTKIYSVAGLLKSNYIKERPFRSPHHTASRTALVGGGKYPKPGEMSLAHRGVLFMDEFPEFPRSVLESLRQPLEDGIVTVSRASGTLTFPARFILIASQNPCPCGYNTDPEKVCVCGAAQIVKYRKKISGPLIDRIDIHVEVPRIKFEKLASDTLAESSEKIRERVTNAREIQEQRFKKYKIHSNSEMHNSEVKKFCKLDEQSIDLLRAAVTQMHLSARAYNRILKLSRTIADLVCSNDIKLEHVAEALQFRVKTD
ncbi:MAG: YifB family Mg chelatase-like AAA ATPase [Patescibacteria group bacterium]